MIDPTYPPFRNASFKRLQRSNIDFPSSDSQADPEKIFAILCQQIQQRFSKRSHSQMKAFHFEKINFSSTHIPKKIQLSPYAKEKASLPANYLALIHSQNNFSIASESGLDIKPKTLSALFPRQTRRRSFFQKAGSFRNSDADCISPDQSLKTPSDKPVKCDHNVVPNLSSKHILRPSSRYFLRPKIGKQIFPIHSLKNPLFRGLRPIRMKPDISKNKSLRLKQDPSELTALPKNKFINSCDKMSPIMKIFSKLIL